MVISRAKSHPSYSSIEQCPCPNLTLGTATTQRCQLTVGKELTNFVTQEPKPYVEDTSFEGKYKAQNPHN